MKKVFGLIAVVVVACFAAAALVVALYPVPEPNEVAIAETTQVYYADGSSEMVQFGDVTRTSIPLDEIPEHVQQAVLAAEDRSYYSHGGVSPQGLVRAVVNNASGGATQGASTITQQYVKNVFLTQEQTISRKLREVVLAVKLDVTQSKEDVLEGYLNTIYFGRGAYGIEAASRAYFGHSASELTIAEGTALAAVIQSPGDYEPELFPAALQSRFDYVVDGLVQQGVLTDEEAAAMELPAFSPRSFENKFGGQTGYLSAMISKELADAGFSEPDISAGGLQVVTTIDPRAQAAAVQAVAEAGPESETEGLRIGVASIDPDTGGILALYGGEDYLTNWLNNATQARSQAGSTFKPFALAAAFEQGISPYSRWNGNSPRTFADYRVENEGNRDYGRITLARATERSVNTTFVSLASAVGIDNVTDAAYRAGVPESTTGPDAGLSFVLGSSSMTPLEMASAYATFAARGVYHEPHIVREVIGADGTVLYRADVPGEQRFAPEVADQVNEVLQGVVTNGTAAKAGVLAQPVAGKTGTTDDNLSAWFVGYAPQASTAVMLSKEDQYGNQISLRGTGGMEKVFGSSFPLGIWTAYNAGFLEGQPIEPFTDDQPVEQEGSAVTSQGSANNSRSAAVPQQRSAPVEQPAPSTPSATPETDPEVPATPEPEVPATPEPDVPVEPEVPAQPEAPQPPSAEPDPAAPAAGQRSTGGGQSETDVAVPTQ